MKIIEFIGRNKKYINIFINIIIILYIFIILFKQQDMLKQIRDNYSVMYLFICFIIYGLAVLSQVVVWVGLTIQPQQNYIQHINSYIYSNIASQLGNIWKYVARILIYKKNYKSSNSIIFLSLVEMLFLLLSGSLLIVYLINTQIYIKLIYYSAVILILFSAYFIKSKISTNKYGFIYWLYFILQLTFINWLGGGFIFYIITKPFASSYNISVNDILLTSCITSFFSVLLQNIPLSSILRNVVYFYYLNLYISDTKIAILVVSILYIYIQLMDLFYNWLYLLVTNKYKPQLAI